MSIDNRRILITILAITLVILPVIFFTDGIFRIILGLLLVIFFPGYSLLSTIFPKQNDLSGIERIAFSFGLSLATVPLTGLILNYTPWGIRLFPVTLSIFIFILITVSIGYYRQQRLPPEERFHIVLRFDFSNWSGMQTPNKILSICLVIAIFAAFGSLGYAIAVPKQGEKFTEFYIMGNENRASDYPRRVFYKEPAEVIIGIINHELEPTSYKIEITLDGSKVGEMNIATLNNEEKHEEAFTFIPEKLTDKQKLEFHLYKDNDEKPYFESPLHLYIDVVSFIVVNKQGQQINRSQLFNRGESVTFLVKLINQEPEETSYRIEVKADTIIEQEIITEPLTHMERWEKTVSFKPEAGKVERLFEFQVYKENEEKPYFESPVCIPIQLNTPPAPELISPEDGTIITADHILFQWSAVEGAVNYILQIYEDRNWSDSSKIDQVELDSSVHTYEIPLISDDTTTYYWRVWSENEAGLCSEIDVNTHSRSFID